MGSVRRHARKTRTTAGHGILVGMVTPLSVALWVYACGDGGTAPPPPDPPRATTIAVSPATVELTALGATEQLTAEVRDQNGNAMAAAAVTWSSGDVSVATVDASGLVTAVANGSATITASAGSASRSAAVTVAQEVAAVAVSPAADTLLARGDTVRLTAAAVDENGHAVAGTKFVWASADTDIATVDASGLVTGVVAGEVEITATSSEVTGRAALTVVAPLPTTIAVTPDTVAFTALGQTAQLSADVRDQIGRPIGDAAISWSSGDTLVATVDSAGLVRARANGSATVAATAGSASRSAAVAVAQEVDAVVVSPASVTIGPGDTLRLAATALDANGHAVAGAVFAWSSSDTRFATVDASGLVKAVGRGAAVVAAVADEVEGSAAVAVGIEAPVWVAFADDSLRLAEGETRVVGVRYWARRLAAPLPIGVSAVEDGAAAADYELSEAGFEIPAGNGVAGTFDLTLAARADDLFAEGEEGIALELSVPGAVEAEVGGALPARIADAPVAACVGVNLAGTPPEPVDDGSNRSRTLLTMQWHSEAADVHLEWVGPYPTREEWIPRFEDHPYFRQGIARPNQPGFHLSDWRIESDGDAARHTMSIEWPTEDVLSLRLRSPSSACDGEPTASCGPDGCLIDRRAGAAGDNGSGAPSAATQSVVATPGIVPPPSMGWPMEVVVPSMERVAVYHLGHCDWGTPATSGTMARWSPSVWPAADTLEWFVSRANWPANAIQSAETLGAWVQRSVFDRFSEIRTADVHMRMVGVREADEAPRPTRDGVNTIHLISPEIHGGTYVYGDWNSETACFEITESDLAVGSQTAMTTDATLAERSWSHDFGHALRLEHAGTFPVRRWSPDPWGWNWEQWRAVSGVWSLDPSMSYGAAAITADETGSFLRLDDKIAISIARPRPGWLAGAGTISGRIHADGTPKPFVHVWALFRKTDGRMDGVGAFADEHGDFRIEGLPAGDYYLWAHPDLEWLANPWLFKEDQGELLDVLLPFPVRVVASQATNGIAINMRSGRPAARN